MFLPRRQAHSHCQVPCGIFDDKARVSALKEDCATITKAMNQVSQCATTVPTYPLLIMSPALTLSKRLS